MPGMCLKYAAGAGFQYCRRERGHRGIHSATDHAVILDAREAIGCKTARELSTFIPRTIPRWVQIIRKGTDWIVHRVVYTEPASNLRTFHPVHDHAPVREGTRGALIRGVFFARG